MSSDTPQGGQPPAEPPRMLIYGLPSAGKSQLTSTILEIPELNPCLWINVDKGTRTIQKNCNFDNDPFKLTRNVTTDKINVVDFKDVKFFQKVYELLKDPKNPYKSLAIDSITKVNDYALNWTLGISNTEIDLSVLSPMATFDNFRRAKYWMEQFLQMLDEINIPIFCTAQPMDRELMKLEYKKDNIATTNEWIVPMVVGEKITMSVLAFFSYIGYIERGLRDERIITFSENTKYYTKDRSDKLDGQIKNPTLKTILKLAGEIN